MQFEVITTEDFNNISQEIARSMGNSDQTTIAKVLDISQGSVSNYLSGKSVPTPRISQKIANAMNNFRSGSLVPSSTVKKPEEKIEKIFSKSEIVERIQGRFDIMTNIVRRMLRQKVNSMIVRAAPGVGKTYNIERQLNLHKKENPNFESFVLSGGGVSAFALYKALYKARNGGVVVLDDNDSFLDSPETLNLLKNALDSSEVRTLTWSKKNSEIYDADFDRDDEDDVRIPSRFEFNGAMIFITNLDFHAIAESNSARAPHLAAMIDRSWYVNLTINTLQEKHLWCEHVFLTHMYESMGLNSVQAAEIVNFVSDNIDRFFILSLRLYKDIASLVDDSNDGTWKSIVEATKFK